MREDDEWFDEPDDLQRVVRALEAIDSIEDPVTAAAVVAFRVARAQAFGEGNKRTAVALAAWLLDHNGLDSERLLPPEDRRLADLVIKAASGLDTEAEIVSLLDSRR